MAKRWRRCGHGDFWYQRVDGETGSPFSLALVDPVNNVYIRTAKFQSRPEDDLFEGHFDVSVMRMGDNPTVPMFWHMIGETARLTLHPEVREVWDRIREEGRGKHDERKTAIALWLMMRRVNAELPEAERKASLNRFLKEMGARNRDQVLDGYAEDMADDLVVSKESERSETLIVRELSEAHANVDRIIEVDDPDETVITSDPEAAGWTALEKEGVLEC